MLKIVLIDDEQVVLQGMSHLLAEESTNSNCQILVKVLQKAKSLSGS